MDGQADGRSLAVVLNELVSDIGTIPVSCETRPLVPANGAAAVERGTFQRQGPRFETVDQHGAALARMAVRGKAGSVARTAFGGAAAPSGRSPSGSPSCRSPRRATSWRRRGRPWQIGRRARRVRYRSGTIRTSRPVSLRSLRPVENPWTSESGILSSCRSPRDLDRSHHELEGAAADVPEDSTPTDANGAIRWRRTGSGLGKSMRL